MNTFHESNYKFKFSADWNVIKYDDHRFYKILSGQNMSGVDFAGIHDEEEAYLIEIKNFKQYKSEKSEKSLEEFCNEIIEKGRDSLQLISIIHKYLHKKFLYNTFYSVVRRFPWFNPEWVFWSEMHRVCIIVEKVNFILLINSDYDHKQIELVLCTNLNDQFKSIKVINLQEGKLLPQMEVEIDDIKF